MLARQRLSLIYSKLSLEIQKTLSHVEVGVSEILEHTVVAEDRQMGALMVKIYHCIDC